MTAAPPGEPSSGPPPGPDGAGDVEPAQSPPQREPGDGCDLCGGPVVERHCKIVCLNCGYQRDCSDP